MLLKLETYSPVIVPINWQSELIIDNHQRLSFLIKHFSHIESLTINSSTWPMGYGSLEHDNLPMFYQPAAIFNIAGFITEYDVEHAELYIYDSCLAVLNIGLNVSADVINVDDLEISRRVETLSEKYLAPILKQIYALNTEDPMIQPSSYKFFVNDKEELTNAKPLWVARMQTMEKSIPLVDYQGWLKNIDSRSDFLLLGSGNSLLTEQKYFTDVHRIMIMSQFHAALMNRIESLLKDNLQQFNSSYYKNRKTKSLPSSLTSLQYRNDHIEFIDIQISAASAGVQGIRRTLLNQFNQAWQFTEQHNRVAQLTSLTQLRLERLSQAKLRQQNRSIQTLLMFLGALGLISLVIDLIGIANDTSHNKSIGLFDLIQFASAEHMINFTFLLVVLLTLYFYRSHE